MNLPPDFPADLTVTQFANLVGADRREVLRRIAHGTLSAYRPLKREWRIPSTELKKFPKVVESLFVSG